MVLKNVRVSCFVVKWDLNDPISMETRLVGEGKVCVNGYKQNGNRCLKNLSKSSVMSVIYICGRLSRLKQTHACLMA